MDATSKSLSAPAAAAQRRALLAMSIGAGLIGTNAMMVRLADVPPTVSGFWRMLFAGVLLCALAARGSGWRKQPPRVWLLCAAVGLVFASDLWAWHRSILLIGPGLSTLLANAQVFCVALAGVWLFGERVGARFIAGLLLSFLGLMLLLGQSWSASAPAFRLGVVLGLLTALSYAAYTIVLRQAQREAERADPDTQLAQVIGMSSLVCAFALGLAGAAEGVSFAIPDVRNLSLLLALAVLGHCVPWLLISKAMQRLSIAMVGLLLLLQPLVAFVLDVVLLHRTTTPREWLGLGLSLVGIFVAGLRGKQRLPEPA